ncbi:MULTISPECIES: glycosyltransferase family 2 protein [Phocaeicola]|jgi:glycosyltransferase involved in cell wall biosynthesis|nr:MULTISPECIES: glycosyltransferase family 2 protein [Phocaeicola]RJU59880.1 glycosyltransferase family 2 protein [Bacteroides sp. AM27-13]MCG0263905.1 glycosyltransferase [Phocaeicola vulgatus]MCS2751411.1 glycosyltransferase [Phocaeicola vulgatus]MDO5880266.1 glycosyltransferase family 2 protein [Phocaeicola vulgatus]MDO6368957.1 glycosyltransferase family 2 protein [Phocaeicola vulgatus]
MKKMFSVIVPIYKVEAFLEKCIESILQQTYENFELILVDDGSPDNCPLICDRYSKKDVRIRTIHKLNGGLVSARNTGLLSAVGDYICYVDGDDWLVPDALQKVKENAIDKYHPDMIIYNMIKEFGDHQQTIPYYVDKGFYSKDKLKDIIYPYMMWDRRKSFYKGLVFPSAGGKIIKRSLLMNHYCQNESIRMGEDNAYIFECLYFADSAFFLPDNLYVYNQLNQGSFLHSYDKKRIKNNRILVDYIKSKLGGKEKNIDEQINAFNAYWLITAIFHEIKCNNSILDSANYLRSEIRENHSLQDININVLPVIVKLYLYLIKMNLYVLALLSAKLINRLRRK